MSATTIQWTDATWNPTTGCTRASAGCDNCYAFTMTKRLAAMGQTKYQGLAGNGHFNGVLKTWDDELEKPLRWRKPRMVFVNSMSDLFHKDVPFEFIDKVFAVMALTPQHTYQVLTKRPERMAEYLASFNSLDGFVNEFEQDRRIGTAACKLSRSPCAAGFVADQSWPLRNVWLGTSVENQEAADERIPHLLRCPAAVRFLSCEPLLGTVDLTNISRGGRLPIWNALTGDRGFYGDVTTRIESGHASIDWVIVGGESGHKARPCNVRHIRWLVKQCKSAAVPCFVKQLGANIEVANDTFDEWPRDGDGLLYDAEQLAWNYQGEDVIAHTLDRKGGNPEEWPEDLRVRQFPDAARLPTPNGVSK